jgi:hypothetical protein
MGSFSKTRDTNITQVNPANIEFDVLFLLIHRYGFQSTVQTGMNLPFSAAVEVLGPEFIGTVCLHQ